MKQVFLFSIYWFVSGVVVGLGLQSIYGFEVVLPCGALNMALGLIGLLIITRHERANKAFYGDPREHEGGWVRLNDTGGIASFYATAGRVVVAVG